MSKEKEHDPYSFHPLQKGNFFDDPGPGKTTFVALKREDVHERDIKCYDECVVEAKLLMLDGDEFGEWEWYLGPLCARGGYCIIRDGKPVYVKGVWLS